MTTVRVLLCLTLLLLPPALRSQTWRASATVDALIERAINEGAFPGAVVVVGHQGKTLHRKAYGARGLQPRREAMTLDTIFDCASLTKVVATTPAIMQLVEQGKVRLGDRVTAYLPEFAAGESAIVVRDLLIHFSGLRPDLDLEPAWSGYQTAIQKAIRETPVAPPGDRFIYSDINFILLAEIVRRSSGEGLESYARTKIFEPLGMAETQFLPPAGLLPRIAPTEKLPDGTFLRGVVHDPTTRFMGGVAGHAGMFSTAGDLSRFAEMMLGLGRVGSARVLSPSSVLAMTASQSPAGQPVRRGLGWDIDSPYSSPRGDLFPVGSYGHTGFTGTSLWIDPSSRTYVILLTSRLHSGAGNAVVGVRARLANIVAASLDDVRRNPAPAGPGQASAARPTATMIASSARVFSGLEVLARDGFAPLRGKRVGLITNQTGIDAHGRRGVDLLYQAEGVALAAIFSPEHGLDGRLDQENVGDSVDAATGVPVYSLYQGERRRPPADLLRQLDVLVFDIQDIGARFYTYVTTMAYAMEEAARLKLPFYVLDRPNPITGRIVEGPPIQETHRSIIGYFPVPVRHGMTAGELARLLNQERGINADLTVVRMQGWRRDAWFDETELPWVNPSPNMRSLTQATLYPGIALLEGLRNCSVGRGTKGPFEFVGADWIRGAELAAYLNGRNLAGVRFDPASRRPTASRFERTTIEGVQITVLDRNSIRPTRVGLEIFAALQNLYPGRIVLQEAARWIGDDQTIEELKAGVKPESIAERWEAGIEEFQAVRRRHLLY